MNARRTGLVSLALLLALSACGLGNEKADEAKKSETPEPTPSDTSSSEVDDAGMTIWGADLTFGEPARFVWSPKANKEGSVELTVDSVEQVKIDAFSGFKLDDALLKSTPYYVRVTATNIGATELGGAELPLFLDNGSDVLYPPANITSAFKPCPNRLLPEKFAPQADAELCLVFLASEGTTLRAVALQTPQGTDQIEWTGELKQKKAKDKKGKKVKKGPPSSGESDAPSDGATD